MPDGARRIKRRILRRSQVPQFARGLVFNLRGPFVAVTTGNFVNQIATEHLGSVACCFNQSLGIECIDECMPASHLFP